MREDISGLSLLEQRALRRLQARKEELTRDRDSGTPYAKEMRRAMTAVEAIAADTDMPTPVRVAAITRVLTFWTAIRDEMQRKGKEHDDAE